MRRATLRTPMGLLAASILLLMAVVFAHAGDVNVSGGAAIDGADPVAYFNDGRYVPGSRDFTAEWNGASWRFASAENRAAFLENPESYAPQYGGYCAWAVSRGYTAKIDPEAWRIVDGKLYLNYSKGVRSKWVRDIPGNIAKADRNWPGLREGLSR